MTISSADFGERVVRVNLTTGKVSTESIDPEVIGLFLGGRGLGAYLLYRENKAGVDPLGPDNKLIFLTGPLCGTAAPGSGRYVLATKSPLTGLYLTCMSGGHFGPELRRAGCDVLILEGKAEKPTYVYIEDGKVALRDASSYWGMTTIETQELLHEDLRGGDVRIACIGPAGENLVPYACIISERRAAGRGGAGAVMGSKNVKAIVVKGDSYIEVPDRAAFRYHLKRAAEELKAHPFTGSSMPLYGTSAMVESLNAVGILPSRNWQRNWVPSGPREISGPAMRPRFTVKDVPCAAPCPVRCSKRALVREGPYAGVFTEGPEYETLYAFGSCCEVWDPAAIMAADALCDSFGLDTISMGVTIAFAMECFERGMLTLKDTDGIELTFGAHHHFSKLIRDTAHRAGFGSMLALGTRGMATQIGRDSSRFAMNVKGMELGGYDPRGISGMALVFACGPRGGCHHAGGYTVSVELAGGKYDRFSRDGKAALVKATRDRRSGGPDSSPMCNFVATGLTDDTLVGMIAVGAGRNLSVKDLYSIGDRIGTVERMFNVREGLTPALDTLPRRLLEEGTAEGPSSGRRVDLDPLVRDFYLECGWDLQTGRPTEEKMRASGLVGVI